VDHEPLTLAEYEQRLTQAVAALITDSRIEGMEAARERCVELAPAGDARQCAVAIGGMISSHGVPTQEPNDSAEALDAIDEELTREGTLMSGERLGRDLADKHRQIQQLIWRVNEAHAEIETLRKAMDGDLFHRCEECGGEQHEAEDGWHCLLCEAHAEIEALTEQLAAGRAPVMVRGEPVVITDDGVERPCKWYTASMTADEMWNQAESLQFVPHGARYIFDRLGDIWAAIKQLRSLASEPAVIQPQQIGHGFKWAYAAMIMGRKVMRKGWKSVSLALHKGQVYVYLHGKQPPTRSVWVMRDADLDATDWVLAEVEVKG